MADYKIGDVVWFFFTYAGQKKWDGATIVIPGEMGLTAGHVIYIDLDDDYVHLYVHGDPDIVKLGYCFLEEYVFESKDKAIAAMQSSLNMIDEEQHNGR